MQNTKKYPSQSSQIPQTWLLSPAQPCGGLDRFFRMAVSFFSKYTYLEGFIMKIKIFSQNSKKNFFFIFDLIQAKTLLVAKGGLPLNSCSSQTIWTTDLGFVPFKWKLSLAFSKVLLQLVKKNHFSWFMRCPNSEQQIFPILCKCLAFDWQ